MSVPRHLTVVYDPDCALCRRCRSWLEAQPTYCPLSFLSADDAAARAGMGRLPVGDELVVLADTGEVWVGPAAYVMCLWATRAYRHWSYRLSGRALEPLARRVFHAVTANRGTISALLRTDDCAAAACAAPAGAPSRG